LDDLLERQDPAITHGTLAKRSGIAASHLSQLYRGTGRASATTVKALCRTLGCRPGTLFPEHVGFEVAK
jgi:DNA-binding Xre family transcriptional regulator